jgi:hypothetical protein
MADERPAEAQPLDYLPLAAPGRRRRLGRGGVVALIGLIVAAGGVAVFVFAHDYTETINLAAEHRRQHEWLMAGLGLALLLCGTAVAIVGLRAWCERGEG